MGQKNTPPQNCSIGGESFRLAADQCAAIRNTFEKNFDSLFETCKIDDFKAAVAVGECPSIQERFNSLLIRTPDVISCAINNSTVFVTKTACEIVQQSLNDTMAQFTLLRENSDTSLAYWQERKLIEERFYDSYLIRYMGKIILTQIQNSNHTLRPNSETALNTLQDNIRQCQHLLSFPSITEAYNCTTNNLHDATKAVYQMVLKNVQMIPNIN